MRTDVLIAGVGNLFLGDDAFGCQVAMRLEQCALPTGVRAKDYGIRGLHLAYEIADGVGALILIDALANNGVPGEVVVLEVDPDRTGGATMDAHSVDPTTVLASVRALGVEPPRTLVVGCEPATIAEGIGLSPVVAAAIEPAKRAVIDMVENELTIKEYR